MNLFTIGFTQKSARTFFDAIKTSGVKRVLDIRLNNVSQLAGFTKKTDLEFFLGEICGVEYIHLPILSPTQLILDNYRKRKGSWADYERDFLQLMDERDITSFIGRDLISDGCLLCSEAKPNYCHRRLISESLRTVWPDLKIKHL